MTTCGALILAGGRGTRIGEPKAALRVRDTTLLERAVAIARAANCDPVRVVAREETPLPPLGGIELVHDPPGDDGPLAAVGRGLEHFDAEADVLVLACDLPNAMAVVERLVALPRGAAAVAVDHTGRAQPLCARYPAGRAREAVASALAAGDRRMRALLDALSPERLDALGDELLNINGPNDLARVWPELNR